MPAISRPVLIALIGAVVALVAFYATQGSRDAAGGGEPAVSVEPAPTAPASDGAGSSAPVTDAPAGAPARAGGKPGAKGGGEGNRAARDDGLPAPLERAIAGRRTVVLLLRGTGSADDRATARAVDALRGTPGLAVFSDRIGRVGRYGTLVGELGITQAPAVVIVGRGRKARVVEGYVDQATLAQDVADAR